MMCCMVQRSVCDGVWLEQLKSVMDHSADFAIERRKGSVPNRKKKKAYI